MKKRLKYIIFIVLTIFFIILSMLVTSKNDLVIDTSVYKFISMFITHKMTTILKVLTFIGSAYVVIALTILLFILLKKKIYSIVLVIDLIAITFFQFILKAIFARNRPIDINLITEDGYSFPSGHSLTAMAFYGMIIYFIYSSKLSKKIKLITIASLVILILLIGISRIYLGVHYATDVLGGFTFSLCYLIVFTSILKNKTNLFAMEKR